MSDAWSICLSHLEAALAPEDFLTWFKPLQVGTSPEAEVLVLYAPNAFVVEVLRERYLAHITTLWSQATGRVDARVRLEIGSRDPGSKIKAKGPAERRSNARAIESNLASSYTFENFIEGKPNQLAKSAAWQVAQNPGQAYNPLLLYGGTGLGKTHLMHAAGNLMLANNPAMRVLYLRSDQFFNAMMKALQEKTMEQFKRQFRDVDALLLDDIQFFAGKNTTQEEFFHT
ncbi:MAG: ATP-binding protein, partial [Xanthomonadales bacterium]|nr:ATP-binding protein [Xanthomonadales bacterium]